jgi:hypothetical protein
MTLKPEMRLIFQFRVICNASFAIIGGFNISVRGHSNIQMVTRYAHPTEKHPFESIKRMEAFRAEPEAAKKREQKASKEKKCA